jgi:hypothetical protein
MTLAWAARRLLVPLALGLLLLCSQQVAIAHWLSHAVHDARTHEEAPVAPLAEHCDDCDGLIAFSAMLPGPAGAMPPQLAFAGETLSTRMPPAPQAATLPVYRSRAPPSPG